MLRLIAVISMTLDHAAYLLIYYGIMSSLPAGSESFMMWNAIYTGLRMIGRMAFPIFAFLLVQGYDRTRNFRNYALRLLILALVSEIPFDWVVTGQWEADLTYQNTVYTLLISLLTIKAAETAQIYLIKWQNKKGKATYGTGGLPTPGSFAIWALAAVIGCAAAYLIGSDYGWEGVALILFIYLLRNNKTEMCLLSALWCVFSFTDYMLPYIIGYAAVFLLLYFYHGDPPIFARIRQKGGAALRCATYLYYPVHLLILWGIYCACFRL